MYVHRSPIPILRYGLSFQVDCGRIVGKIGLNTFKS